MTVELSVADVREALLAAGAAPGPGVASSLLLGRIFHQSFADLVSDDPDRSGLELLSDTSMGADARVQRLEAHVWRRLLAPRLLRHAASFQDEPGHVLALWTSVRALSRWLEGVTRELVEQHPSARSTWALLASLLRREVPLACEITEPRWSEPVRLVGIADAVVHMPGGRAFCAIELKVGRGVPVVDLGQVALYHLVLSRSAAGEVPSALALLRFDPELHEHLLQAEALIDAQTKLVALIGRLAGVAVEPPPAPARRAVPPPPEELKDKELPRRLVRACHEQGVGLELRDPPRVGPRFVRFDVRLAAGVKVDALKRRTAELQHRLNLNFEPLVIQEAGHLFIDLPRPSPRTVRFSDILSQLPAADPLLGSSQIPIGVDASGVLRLADLGSSGRSHVLVAGATGSGKSEWLRMMLAGLSFSNSPHTLRFVTLDPKLAAFSDLEQSPFLWRQDSFWVPGPRPASELFEDLILEMDRRYQETRASGSDSLAEHITKTGRPLPRIVCVCDEYFALVSQSKDEKRRIEGAVALLGAKARAAGIHLVLATQQPSRAIIQGVIQSNLPCRVALTLQNAIESRMILAESGAESLTFQGDLLYKDIGAPVRLQAPWLAPEERARWLRGGG